MKKLHLLFSALIILCGCKLPPENAAETIYFGGDIITMEGDKPIYSEAVVVNNGTIVFVGNKEEALNKY